ncbi:HAD family hydrolase [Sphingomonas sp. TDK1]|uniref:HAD family hydrolase n=1 Tax=Sphingomonas sp. TDK1 TaxID=453247 RepID=UPI000A84ED64|nr:HAD family hydrolase [Sphingomonas sp. TDK1]
MHIALGGCLKAPPVAYGLTADTGGHIAYILEAAGHQARQPGVAEVSIVTRAFTDEAIGDGYAVAREAVAPRLVIERITTGCTAYLEKEALAANLPAFIDAFCGHLDRLPRRPDVLHAHFADAAAVAIAVERRFGIPFVYTPHALGIDKRRQGIQCEGLEARIAAERTALEAAGAVIVSTQEEVTRQIGGYGVPLNDRVHCIAPGVPSHAMTGSPATLVDRLRAWLADPSRPIILAVARPVAKKNLAALVRAYAASPTLQARANLVILAGQHELASGEERAVLDELRALAAGPALAGRIALPPRHDGADVAALYARAAKGGVFVNPALHEPFGLTLLEAADAGVPVVATQNGGPAEIIADIGHGVLVDPRNTSAIGEAIAHILDDPERHAALSSAGRRGVERYRWDAYAAESLRLYRNLATPQVLACDIDNTLTGCSDGASAFTAWRDARILPFLVATGRSLDSAQHILAAWKLPAPDALIVDVGTRLMLAGTDGRWQECPRFAQSLDEGWDRDAVARTLLPLGIQPQPPETAGPHKLSFFGDAADTDRIREALARAGLRAKVIFSHGHLIDVIAPMGGKASAIAAYARQSGWSLAQVVAAGDSGNDRDMLTACGHAIVVGNAGEELADLPARPGLHRVSAAHAHGVLEGLAQLGLATPAAPIAVAA